MELLLQINRGLRHPILQRDNLIVKIKETFHKFDEVY
jgi:hypothetical protein